MAWWVWRRLVPILILIVCLAPGTWLRSPATAHTDIPISVRVIETSGATFGDQWALDGVWEYQARSRAFGGFSALLALDGHRLQAFSDRGFRFTFPDPDPDPDPNPNPRGPAPRVPSVLSPSAAQLALQPTNSSYIQELWDIEAATLDPKTQHYWLAYENTHAFQRFSPSHRPDGERIVSGEVDWAVNSGAEAFVRLRDGRFLVIPESGGEGLIYPADPVTGAAPSTFTYTPSERGFGITDAKQLPDGRLMLIVRKVVYGLPPFDARIALARVPEPDEPQIMKAMIALDLATLVPPENYEGLALRERADGAVDVWLISDDNMSVMQRTLLAKLRFDPSAGEALPHKQKAHE